MLDKKKFLYIIPKGSKSKIFILFFLSFVGVILEVIGIGLILPVVSLISDSSGTFFGIDIKSYHKNSTLLKDFEFTKVIFLFLFIVFFLKFCFSLFLSWHQATFMKNFAIQISKNLFKKYMFADYTLYLKKDSAELIRNVISEANSYIKKAFIPTLHIAMDILILMGIMFLIFSVDFKSSLILVSIYFTFAALYLLLIKKKLYQIGVQQLEHDKLKIKSSQESFLGIKIVKTFLKEFKFIDKFNYHFEKVANLSRIQGFIHSIPRHFIELITISSFIVLSLVLLDKEQNFNEIVPALALFVASAFRIVPSVNRLMLNNQMLRSGISTLNNLYNELKNLDNVKITRKEIKKLYFSKEFLIKNLSFSYSVSLPKILDNIDLKIKKGEAIGIIGKTGSGKTTLIDLILGLISPSEGEILIDGKNIFEMKRSWMNIIGYVPQDTFLMDDTIQNNITFEISNDVEQKALEEAIIASKLKEFLSQDKKSEGLNMNVGERGVGISGGQKQRIGIARALYKNPEIVIFDESTSSLDSETEKSVMKSIYNLKGDKTLIIVSHRNSTLNQCDKIYEIKDKNIIQVK